jgi:hypothetical protein
MEPVVVDQIDLDLLSANRSRKSNVASSQSSSSRSMCDRETLQTAAEVPQEIGDEFDDQLVSKI